MNEVCKEKCRTRLVALWVADGADEEKALQAALSVYPKYEEVRSDVRPDEQ